MQEQQTAVPPPQYVAARLLPPAWLLHFGLGDGGAECCSGDGLKKKSIAEPPLEIVLTLSTSFPGLSGPKTPLEIVQTRGTSLSWPELRERPARDRRYSYADIVGLAGGAEQRALGEGDGREGRALVAWAFVRLRSVRQVIKN